MTNTLPLLVRQKPRGWWPMAIGAAMIASYGFLFLFLGEKLFSAELAESFRARSLALYTHVFFAAIALAIGPLQFHRGLMLRRRALHRTLGKIYVVAAIAGGGLAGLYMASYSFGGLVTHLGFGTLAVLTGTTTVIAYIRIRGRQVAAHREWMIRSYALIFAAVMLRILLPLLIIAYQGEFAPAYSWISWLCWVPNLLFAEWHIRGSRRAQQEWMQAGIPGVQAGHLVKR